MKPLAVSGLIDVFKKIWPEFWGLRMEYILRSALLSLVDVPGATLLAVPRLFDDLDFRTYVIGKVQNPEVRRYNRNPQSWDLDFGLVRLSLFVACRQLVLRRCQKFARG
jgi:hypothetical protein